ncbi:MAG: MBL fold metallo-hydrolase [Nevskiaceae bacterium]|nr:MAG: MBL fold metallo-hydrolase [Nevskiaceae bacterium]
MKRTLLLMLSALVIGGALLAFSFTPATLPVDALPKVHVPEAHPPADMRLYAIEAGKMLSQAAFAYRGGHFSEARTFGMGGILVKHPQGALLFDTGFGKDVDEHFKTIPALMRATSRYEKEPTVAAQLHAAGIEPSALKAVILTHAHWDHVSGLADLPGAPVWVDDQERSFIKYGDDASALIRSFGDLPYRVYNFPSGPYLGFDKSYDVFGDGSVVLVPASGHTPGSIIAFIATPDGKRYALVGDLVWQTEGIELPAERPWISRQLVDWDDERVRALIVHMHKLKAAMPDLVIVPAHDRRVWDALPHLSDAR